MSFAGQTKKELTLVIADSCCRRTEMEAILAQSAEIVFVDDTRKILVAETENVATARRIYTQMKEQFHLQPEVAVRKKMRLKKNNVYGVRTTFAQAEQLVQSLGWALPEGAGHLTAVLPKRVKACCKKAFLRGAFLAAGSVNAPGSNSYHLEINASSAGLANQIQTYMNHFGLHAKQIRRKKGYVVYLKEGEKIVEFLSVIGAHQALLKFEDVRIIKGMRNQVNRLVNCETANMNKTISAAVRQVEMIQYIDHRIGLEQLPPHLREVAEMRLELPETNLQELSERLSQRVSKSGLNHRFRKLEQIADQLREGTYVR